MIAGLADALVGVVRAGHRKRAWLSAGARAMTFGLAPGDRVITSDYTGFDAVDRIVLTR